MGLVLARTALPEAAPSRSAASGIAKLRYLLLAFVSNQTGLASSFPMYDAQEALASVDATGLVGSGETLMQCISMSKIAHEVPALNHSTETLHACLSLLDCSHLTSGEPLVARRMIEAGLDGKQGSLAHSHPVERHTETETKVRAIACQPSAGLLKGKGVKGTSRPWSTCLSKCRWLSGAGPNRRP